VKKTKAQKKREKFSRARLQANLSLMVPLNVSLNWAIRGPRPDPNKVMAL